MTRATAFTVVIAVGLAVGHAAVPQTARFGTPEDEEAIRNVIVAMTRGFNSRDAKAATEMYVPDARLVTVRGEIMDGRAQVEKGLASIFATRAKNATHRTADVSVRFIRPDVALAYVTNELSGLVAPDGQALPPHQELSLRVFVKEVADWRVAAFHNTMIRPFGAPAR